jgi:hypothetical protein
MEYEICYGALMGGNIKVKVNTVIGDGKERKMYFPSYYDYVDAQDKSKSVNISKNGLDKSFEIINSFIINGPIPQDIIDKVNNLEKEDWFFIVASFNKIVQKYIIVEFGTACNNTIL